MNQKPFVCIALLLGLALALPAGAADPRDPDYVFTNADLEQLEPLPSQDEPLAEYTDRGWEFVTEFLERERRQLAADRAYELDRARLEAETREPSREGYGLALAPYGWGYGYPHRPHHDRPDRPRPEPSPHVTSYTLGFASGEGRITPLHARPGGRIVPLHARPGGRTVPLHARPPASPPRPAPQGRH